MRAKDFPSVQDDGFNCDEDQLRDALEKVQKYESELASPPDGLITLHFSRGWMVEITEVIGLLRALGVDNAIVYAVKLWADRREQKAESDPEADNE